MSNSDFENVGLVMVEEPVQGLYQVVLAFESGREARALVRNREELMKLVEPLGARDRVLYRGRSWVMLTE